MFRITIADDDVAHRVETLFRSFRVRAAAPVEKLEVRRASAGNDLVLTRDGIEIVRTPSYPEMTGALFHVLLSSLHPRARWLAMIHGGSVSIDGRTVLLAGTSGSGKTTLGAFLIARGFDYFSDDVIAVTQDGRIAPWPVPFSIKEGAGNRSRPIFRNWMRCPPNASGTGR